VTFFAWRVVHSTYQMAIRSCVHSSNHFSTHSTQRTGHDNGYRAGLDVAHEGVADELSLWGQARM
jgi:hypothetical protein